jgi:predicted permease
MGMKIEAGRTFTAGDRPDAPGVAIVTRAMANRYWKDGDAIGRRVKFEADPKSPWITIVGIASDVRQLGLKHAPTPILFIPYTQFPLPFMSISVRTTAPDAAAHTAIRAAIATVDPEIPPGDIRTLDQIIGFQIAEPRFRSFVIASFAIVTLVLAAVGLYGLISFSVAQQTREIGIRVALGAAPAQVVGPMLRRGLALAASGVGIGLVGAFFASRVIAQFLFGVTATDPLTIAGVSGLLIVVALIATWIPSRRALRVDPIVALRAE